MQKLPPFPAKKGAILLEMTLFSCYVAGAVGAAGSVLLHHGFAVGALAGGFLHGFFLVLMPSVNGVVSLIDSSLLSMVIFLNTIFFTSACSFLLSSRLVYTLIFIGSLPAIAYRDVLHFPDEIRLHLYLVRLYG